MRNSILSAALIAAGFVGFMAGGATVQRHAYDYERCDWMVRSLDAAPPMNEWKEATRTPHGNWCLTVQASR